MFDFLVFGMVLENLGLVILFGVEEFGLVWLFCLLCYEMLEKLFWLMIVMMVDGGGVVRVVLVLICVDVGCVDW